LPVAAVAVLASGAAAGDAALPVRPSRRRRGLRVPSVLSGAS
jgi:hypothetical protein